MCAFRHWKDLASASFTTITISGIAMSGLVAPVAYAQSSASVFDDALSSSSSASDATGGVTGPTATNKERTYDQPATQLDADGDIGEELQAALNKAAEDNTGVTLDPSKQYSISQRVSIPAGVAYFDGNGAEISVNLSAGSREEAVSAFEFARGATGTIVNNLVIDLNNQDFVRGISGESLSDVTISNLELKNVVYRGIQLSADHGPLTNVTVEGNTIDNEPGDINKKGHSLSIMVTAKRDETDEQYKNSASPIWERYVNDGTVAPTSYGATGLKILNNTIHGGYYGISFSGVSDSTIANNTITANTRNISIQNNCSNNVIENNQLSDSISSAVHIAYNSDNNQITGNAINTDKSRGQGLLQAYQASDGNTFSDNEVTVSGDAHPSWILYVGTDSHNTTFNHNRISGKATHAVVGIESVWDSESARSSDAGEVDHNAYSYMSGNSIENPATGQQVTYGGGHGELRGITIRDNVFTPNNDKAPVFYIGADVSKGHDGTKKIIGNVVDLNIGGNEIVGENFSETIVTHTGSIPDVGTATIEFSDDSITK